MVAGAGGPLLKLGPGRGQGLRLAVREGRALPQGGEGELHLDLGSTC